jgi:hypothetical protein
MRAHYREASTPGMIGPLSIADEHDVLAMLLRYGPLTTGELADKLFGHDAARLNTNRARRDRVLVLAHWAMGKGLVTHVEHNSISKWGAA